MDEKEKRELITDKNGFFYDLSLRMKLVLRLMADPRVSPLVKLLPIGAVIYFVIPDLAPGPIDDAAILFLGTYVFVELCPPDVVAEHEQALQQAIPGKIRDAQRGEEDVIDADYWESD
ncbi:MAG TPA: hypothetical protein VLS48_08210 [Anaerolineales bacterium]|nr:hypothetical protein [Anaerolineales bacterium]